MSPTIVTARLGDVVVLAGGLGTRLRSEVPDLPKPLAPVAGRPFITWLLDALCAAGAQRVILAEGYRAEAFREILGEHWRGVPLVHVVEPQALGTGGAIAHAMRQAGSSEALVLNGDTLVMMDYVALVARCQENSASLGIAVRPVDDVARYGGCQLRDGELVAFSEKGRSGAGLINAGVYHVQASLFERLGLSERFSFEQDLIPQLLGSEPVLGLLVDGYFIDIGVPDDYRRAQHELPALSPPGN